MGVDIAVSDIIMHEVGSQLMNLQGDEFNHQGSDAILNCGVFVRVKFNYTIFFSENKLS